MRLVLFDFDKTLTTKDSFIEFLKFAVPSSKLLMNSFFLLPWFGLYKLGFYSSEKFKKRTFKTFFYGYKENDLKLLGERFAREKTPSILNDKINSKMLHYLANGDEIVIVSASLNVWLEPWASSFGVKLLCTDLKFENDIFLGEFSNKNCKGEEKKNRILSAYDLNLYSDVICYGNKGDDEPMMSLAFSDKNRIIVS